MRNITGLVLAALIAGGTLESRRDVSQTAECAGPGEARITAQQLSAAPPSYAFLVTNLANVAISGIMIGRHDLVLRIMGVAPNVPVRMESPPGWAGVHVHLEESAYMVYLWENKDASKRIMPQQSAAGFRIVLPEAGRDPIQATFDRLPFKVSMADGSCRWGFTGVDRIEK
jgi:hypothetical protein